jgi:hypothetical protein
MFHKNFNKELAKNINFIYSIKASNKVLQAKNSFGKKYINCFKFFLACEHSNEPLGSIKD